jgi:ribosomal protein S18 acetylase RimI-like enzyme
MEADGIEIREVLDPDEKSRLILETLKRLPEWFGIPASIAEYAHGVRDEPFYAAFQGPVCLGFFAGKIHYGHTGEIYVCAILKEWHRRGLGKRLYARLEELFRSRGCEFAMVKTLSDKADYAPYRATHAFYRGRGFKELLTLTEMWDAENPCLIMVKVLT